MASPFKIFRKNQKAALAVLGVLVIVGFVILPAWLKVQSDGGGYTNPVVVETSEFGDLKQSDIQKLIGRRQAVIRFARNIRTQVLRLGGEGRAVSQFLRRIGDEPTEEGVVRAWLLTRRAQQAGIIISEDVINNFIEQLTERRIDNEQIKGILSNIGVSDTLLFDVLHDELLAREMEFEMQLGLGIDMERLRVGTTPGQRWEYFQRINRQATVEVIPVAVSEYVSKVTQKPDSKTLKEFFDEHKDRNPNPNSPDWGFRRPKRVSLRYFKADLESFTDVDAVTDEQVKSAYEEDKERWDARAEALAPVAPPDDEAQPDDAADDTELPPKDPPTADMAPTDASPDPTEKDATTEPDAEPSDTSEKPADTTPPDETPQPGDGDSSATEGASPFRSVSLLQETAPDSETGDAEPDPPKESPATSAPAEPEPEAAAPDGEPEVEAPAVDKTPEPDLPPVTPDDGKQDETEKEPVDPLKGALGEEIRKELAGIEASTKIDEIFKSLESEMDAYRRGVARHTARPATTAPKKLNFKKLADKYALTEGYLKEKSQLEMRESAVATSITGTRFLVDDLYDTRRDELYQPIESVGYSDNSRYLSWKETQTESRKDQKEKKEEDRIALHKCYGVPEFDEPGIAEEVLAAWKTEQARPLAVEAAEALAKKAGKAGKPLADVFPEHDVKTTDPFTWLTFGSMPAGLSQTPPRISEVEGVDRPGPDFFRKVIELKAGDVGVALNYPRTIVYVVRVVEVNPTRERLWKDFTTDVAFQRLVFPRWGLQQDMYEINVALQEELESSAGLKWIRPPERYRNQ